MTEPAANARERGTVSMTGVMAQSVGFMGPVFSVATLLPLIVGLSATGHGAGVATPVAIVIAGVGIFGAGWIIAQYARRIHLCGSLYEYICDAFGTGVGVVAGWLYYGAMLVLASATFLVLGGMTSDLLLSAFGLDVPWWQPALVFVVVVVSVVVVGVQISVRAQLALVLISSAIILAFSIDIIAKGGAGGHSLSAQPLNPLAVAPMDLLYGVLYGINMFIGFESAANLAEETDDPKRHIPRAVLWSLTIVGVYFVITAYAQAVGFGLDAEAWKTSVFPLQALSNGAEFGSTWFGNVVAVLIILDVLAVAIGVGVAATRGMFAMARAGQLPAALATLHSRRGTPVVGAAVVGAAAVGSIALVVLTDGVFPRDGADAALTPQWAPMFGWMAGFAGTGLALIYLVVSCAGARGLWNEVSRVKLVLAATAGTIVAAGAVFGALYKTPLTSLPWALSLWIVLGVGWSAYVARRGKQEPALPVPADSDTPQPGTSPDTTNQPRGVGHL